MLTEKYLSLLQKYDFEHMEINYDEIILEGERSADYFILDTILVGDDEYIIMLPVEKLDEPFCFEKDENDTAGIQVALKPPSNEIGDTGQVTIDDEEEFNIILEAYKKYLRSKLLN